MAIHARQPALRIDHPHEFGAGREPIGDLGENLAGPIAGRQHLDDEIGSEGGEAGRFGVRQALAPNERDIGCSNRVRVVRQSEPRFGRVYRAQPVCVDMVRQVASQLARDPAVPPAGWFPDDEYTLHELEPLLGDANVQQVVRGHEGGVRHVRNVGVFGRHGNLNAARGASTRDQSRALSMGSCDTLTGEVL